jgi:hypothetical protein
MATTFKQITGKQTIIDPVKQNTLKLIDSTLLLTRFVGPHSEQEMQITIDQTYIQITRDQVKELLTGCIDFLSEEHLNEI